VAQPVIGTRRNIERFTRAELLEYVAQQYSGANVVVGVCGPVDHDAVVKDVEAAFGTMPRGQENIVAVPAYCGGIKLRQLTGYSQAHLVLGFPIPALADDDAASVVAAALFGEGMSSPLMDQIRERRGLVYYAACSADVLDLCGQFVIEASTAPEHVDEFFVEVMRLLDEHAQRIDPVDLERARNQLLVRSLRVQEKPYRQLEEAALDLFVHGAVRARAERLERIEAVTTDDLRDTFARMLAAGASVAMAGKIPRAASHRLPELVGVRIPAAAARPRQPRYLARR
jgi:predicted Zn-dependent peptidase